MSMMMIYPSIIVFLLVVVPTKNKNKAHEIIINRINSLYFLMVMVPMEFGFTRIRRTFYVVVLFITISTSTFFHGDFLDERSSRRDKKNVQNSSKICFYITNTRSCSTTLLRGLYYYTQHDNDNEVELRGLSESLNKTDRIGNFYIGDVMLRH